jgi:D-xylose 1-dehydrogenase (NADP+, D-xylono-1,5-lactone-forming)
VTLGNAGGEGVRWGVLSTARINEAVLAGADGSSDVEFVAVASRSQQVASEYAEAHGIPRAHGSYEGLLADSEVEAVYIPLPNGLHVEWTLAALEAGKHVLVEKAFSPRASEVERCFDVAEERGLVLSEGFMWRHTPQADRLLALLQDGAIGELRLLRACFSFPLVDRDDDVRWDPALDGGAMLDVGCYCVNGLRFLAGAEPERVAGEAVMTERGVDVRFAGTLRFPGALLATFDCGFDLPVRDELEAVGSEGSLFLDDPWHSLAPSIEVRRSDGSLAEVIEIKPVNSYRLELEDVSAAIRGRPDGPRLGRADAVCQARTLEDLLESAAAAAA